jgi:hypothetical protein
MRPPVVTILASGDVVLRFPFDRWLVEALKTNVPAYARTYDATSREWMISPTYTERAGELVASVFPDVQVIDFRGARSSAPPTRTTPATSYSVLHLLPTAPPELVESAYRTLSRLHHPDAGGDTAEMQELNHAVARIRRIRA